mmetsp:Transcript_99298/g.303646  ORF Transcript_99298/g.303646 Transcript_99298/m.303646 type:complete len:297 (+) Transcript_99298:331-1221(+)
MIHVEHRLLGGIVAPIRQHIRQIVRVNAIIILPEVAQLPQPLSEDSDGHAAAVDAQGGHGLVDAADLGHASAEARQHPVPPRRRHGRRLLENERQIHEVEDAEQTNPFPVETMEEHRRSAVEAPRMQAFSPGLLGDEPPAHGIQRIPSRLQIEAEADLQNICQQTEVVCLLRHVEVEEPDPSRGRARAGGGHEFLDLATKPQATAGLDEVLARTTASVVRVELHAPSPQRGAVFERHPVPEAKKRRVGLHASRRWLLRGRFCAKWRPLLVGADDRRPRAAAAARFATCLLEAVELI